VTQISAIYQITVSVCQLLLAVGAPLSSYYGGEGSYGSWGGQQHVCFCSNEAGCQLLYCLHLTSNIHTVPTSY